MIEKARLIKNAIFSAGREILRSAGHRKKNLYPAETLFFSEENKHLFCGYYDTNPLNQEQTKILALRADIKNISPHDRSLKADIGLISIQEKEFSPIAQISAWNWQQGCRQHWLPKEIDTIIHNDFLDGRFVSIVRNINEPTLKRIYDHPIYAIHPEGHEALTLDFSRLHRFRRGYGYHNAQSNSFQMKPDDEGLWKLDLQTGNISLLVSLRALASFEPQQDMDNAHHYINHIQYAPDRKTITFFHLWHRDGKKKASRFMVLKPNGSLYTFGSKIRPSHTAWSEKGILIVTGQLKNSRALYSLHPTLQHEYAIPLNIFVDGHPSFIDETNFISDTYPDALGHQKLFIATKNKAYPAIASFYLPPDYKGEVRCDLHPRLSHDKKTVIVDIVQNGFRSVAQIPILRKK